MRSWIFNRIKALEALPDPYKVEGQIISSGSADNPTGKFLIVSMGLEMPALGMPASSLTQSIPFTVWVHDEPGSMLNIDDACVALKNGLPTRDGAVAGGMSVFEIRWESTGEDSYDDHFGSNTRPVRFTMMTKRAG